MGMYVLSLVFLAIGIGMTALVLFTRDEPAPPQWNKTTATIDEVSLEETPGDDETIWTVAAKYSYVVDGEPHIGTTIAEHYHGSSDRATEEKLYNKLQAAGHASVYYNPADPKVSFLTWRNDPYARVLLYWGTMLIIISLGIFLHTWLEGLEDHGLLESIRVP